MPIEGAAVYQTLNSLLAEQTQAAERARETVGEIEREMQDLLDQRAKSLMSLAQHFLPELTKAAIEGNFQNLRGDLLAILTEKENRRRELAGTRDAIQNDIRKSQQTIDRVTKSLDAKVVERGQLEAKVAEILKTNGDFQERSKLALQAEERLHRNEQRVAEMKQEAAEKLPRYQKSRLFRYLLAREYGQPSYNKKGIIAELDRWVAGMIRFNEARVGYDFLKNTPPLVEEEVAKRRALFNELMGQVEAIEKSEADKIGLTAVLKEGDSLGTERDTLVKQVESLNRKSTDAQNELQVMDAGQDSFYKKALDRFGTFLGQTRTALLEQRARQTPGTEDDAIVREIAQLDERMASLKSQLDSLADDRQTRDRIAGEFEQIVMRFRSANYDSGRSYFEDYPSIPEACTDFQSGRLDVNGFWNTIQQAQRFRPNWVATSAEVIASPTGRAILGAMVDLAGGAMQAAAYRGVQRRSDITFPSMGGGGGSAPVSMSPPSSSSSSEGNFTTGDGF